jgi:hypothetical protein
VRNNARHRISVTAKAFLAAFERCGSISGASRIAKCDAKCHYRWLERWPEYLAHYERSYKRAEANKLERCVKEAERRAVKGMRRVVRDKQGRAVFDWIDEDGKIVPPEDVDAKKRVNTVTGKPVLRRQANENKYSDLLLIFLMKKLDPSYRENHKVEIGGEISHHHRIDEKRVKQILADRESAHLANTLARRVAMLAGGDGEPSN